MSLEEDIQLLSQVKMLSDFEAEHLRLLSFGSQKMSFSKGHELFREGQHTDGGYAVISGKVELISYDGNDRKSLGIFSSGSLIGEIALISVNQRIGTAVVLEDCELMKITRSTMHRILNEYPHLAAALHNNIAASIISFTKDLEKIRI